MSISLWIDKHPSLLWGRAEHKKTSMSQLQTTCHLFWLLWFCFSLSQFTKRKETRVIWDKSWRPHGVIRKQSQDLFYKTILFWQFGTRIDSSEDVQKKIETQFVLRGQKLHVFGIYYLLIISHDLDFKFLRSSGPHGDYNQ